VASATKSADGGALAGALLLTHGGRGSPASLVPPAWSMPGVVSPFDRRGGAAALPDILVQGGRPVRFLYPPDPTT